jgi:hypothetical protein
MFHVYLGKCTGFSIIVLFHTKVKTSDKDKMVCLSRQFVLIEMSKNSDKFTMCNMYRFITQWNKNEEKKIMN